MNDTVRACISRPITYYPDKRIRQRIAEMTPHLAGDDDIGSSAHKTQPEEVVHQPNIAVNEGQSYKRSNDER
jgi:hypothetical protein